MGIQLTRTEFDLIQGEELHYPPITEFWGKRTDAVVGKKLLQTYYFTREPPLDGEAVILP